MACSSAGSLRMNSAENPPTVDCSVIGTAGLKRMPRVRIDAKGLCLSWSVDRATGFKKLAVQEAWGSSPLGASPAPLQLDSGKGVFNMSASLIWPAASADRRPFRARGARALVFPAIVLLLCTSLLAALETPSKPFLEKNSFSLVGRISRAARQRSRRAKGDARAAGASLRDA